MIDAPCMLVRDIETRSTVDLGDVGLYNYATHPTTEVLCVGYCMDGEPVKLWRPGAPIPPEFKEAKRSRHVSAVAHQAPFEMAIEAKILGPRFGFPVVPIERNVCTMAIAHALALPAGLGKLAKALRCDHQKDSVGARLMLQLAKPRKARKSEDPNLLHWFEDEPRLIRLGAYCIEDVETAREIAYRLPWLTDAEYAVWLLDQRINARGVSVDRELALAARQITDATTPYINDEMTKVTNGAVTAFTQVAKLKVWLSQFCEIGSLDKVAIEDLLQQELPEHALRAIELRYLGAQAAAKKVDALLAHCGHDGRVRDAFVYHAAGTGRWSSRGVQLHNLKRPDTAPEDLQKAIEIIGQGEFEKARAAYDNPISTIGDLIRAMIIATYDHVLMGADFSGIEARITAWLAGEESKLDVFREFDAGRGIDPYIIAAAAVLNLDAGELAKRHAVNDLRAREERQIGKACELAFGYQGGRNALCKFAPGGDPISLTPAQASWLKEHGTSRNLLRFMKLLRIESTGDEIADLEEIAKRLEKLKNQWRKKHPNIVAMWGALSNAAWRATRHPGTVIKYKDKLEFLHDGESLWITLPSGRKLHYPECRIRKVFIPKDSGIIIETPKGKPALIFKDNASGQWRDVNIYGGLICENAVQAIARDLLARAMLRLDAAGFDIVAHVHDEAIVEVLIELAEKLKPKFHKLMTVLPSWAKGLPVVAKAWIAPRYVK